MTKEHQVWLKISAVMLNALLRNCYKHLWYFVFLLNTETKTNSIFLLLLHNEQLLRKQVN